MEGDARASGEFRAVLVEELGYRARGAAGDLAEGAGRVVVLAGQDRPLARELIPRESAEALSTDRRATCPIEEIPAAALIPVRCRTPPVPAAPPASNNAPIPSS